MEIGNRDLDKIDPDWRFAYFHAKSTQPGRCTEEHPELCDCCLNVIHKEPINIGVHAKELQFMGFAFPLWFSFLKYCIVLTVILIVSESCVSVYQAIDMNKQLCIDQYKAYLSNTVKGTKHQHNFMMRRAFDHNSNDLEPIVNGVEVPQIEGSTSKNIQPHATSTEHPEAKSTENVHPQSSSSESNSDGSGNLLQEGHGESSHHGPKCTGFFILLSRIDAEIDELETVLRTSTFFIIMFTLLFIRDTIYKTEQYYDERRCSLSDYSLIITKLPAIDGIQGCIKKFFAEGLIEGYKVEEMILIPELQDLQEVQHQKAHHTQKLQKLYQSGKQKHEHEIGEIQKEIQQLEDKEERFVEQFRKSIQHDKLHSESVIVILNTEPEKEKFMKEFEEFDKQELVKFFGPQGMEVIIDQAPEPRQIIWENINYPTDKRFGRIVLGWFLSCLFIGLVTLGFYFILRWKTHIVEEKQSLQEATIIVFTALILVILFNKFIMGYILHHFTEIEKHATSDKEQFSFAFKYALGMFFTTALMTLFVEALTYNNFYQHHYGVIEQQSIMFFMNSLLVPIIWAINPFQIYVLIRRKLNFGKKHLTQRQANHIMEDFHYDVGKRYAQVLETMWFTFLYVSLIPMGSFLTVIGIGLYYWVDKYNLLRRSSIHENVSGKLSIIALKLLDLVLIFMPLGQIIFDHFLRHDIKLITVLRLAIGIIYVCLPLNDIIDFLNKENFYLEEKPYRQVKHTFKDNYYSLHPMYSKTNAEDNTESRKLYKEQLLKQYGSPVFSFAMGWLNQVKNDFLNSNFMYGKSNAERETQDKNSIGKGSSPNVIKFNQTH